MLDIPYINYKELDEFYTVNETCQLLNTPATTVPVGRANGAVKPLK